MPRPMIAAILALPAIVATLPLAAVMLFHDSRPSGEGVTTAAITVDTDAILDAIPVAYGAGSLADGDCPRGQQAPDADS